VAIKSPIVLKPSQRELLSRIPDDLSEYELVRYYTLSDEDRRIIDEQTYKSTCLGFAVQLSMLRFPGFTLGQLPEVPEGVLHYLANQLGVAVKSFEEYQRSSTRADHLSKIRWIYGYRDYGWAEQLKLTRQLLPYAMESDQSLALVELALQLMREQRIIIPGITVVERLVWNVKRIAEARFHKRLTRTLDHEQQQKLKSLLGTSRELPTRTGLGWLRKATGKPSAKSLKHLVDRIEYIESFHLPALPVNVHPHRVRQLARRASQYVPQAIANLENEQEQLALLAAHLSEMHHDYIDQSLDMVDEWLTDLFRQGQLQQRRHIQTNARALHREVHRLARAAKAFVQAHDEKTDPFEAVFSTVSKTQLLQSIAAIEATARPANLDFRDLLEPVYRKRRQAFLTWYCTLKFRPVQRQEPALDALDHVIYVKQNKNKRITATELRVNGEWLSIPLEHLKRKRWRTHALLPNQKINPNFYEMAALDRLRARIRSGDIAVVGSRRYQEFDSYLLSPADWRHLKSTQQTRLTLSDDPVAYLEACQTQIVSSLSSLYSSSLEVDDKGKIHLAALEKLEEAETLVWRDRIHELLPSVQLADLLIEVDQWTDFLSHFTHSFLNDSPTGRQKSLLIATLMALGMNIGFEGMAKATDYSVAELAATADWYIREETLQATLIELDNFVLHQPYSQVWGDGSSSSSDGLRMTVHGSSPHAVLNRRYFGRERGVSIITHVADIYMPFGRQYIISTNDREALYVIDGLCHHETDLNILEHYTDTAGYTYHVFALCAFLGFRFAPGIQSITEQLLFSVAPLDLAEPFEALYRGVVDVPLIVQHWDEARRLAASIRHGSVSAALIMRKLAAYPRQNQLAKALREIGKLERTRFVLLYLQDEALRRRVRIGLNKGELLYKLARALFFGQAGEFHDQSFQNQFHRASCLMLLIAAIVAWNTRYFQQAVHWLDQHAMPVPAHFLPHISPISWRHINFLGRYSFNLDQQPAVGTFRPLNV
jgi:TnpA family transposase